MTTRTWKSRIFCATSLDGSIARQNHDITWLTQPFPNAEHAPPSQPQSTMTLEQHMADVDFIVMGRKTFDVCMSEPEWPYPEKKLLVLSTTVRNLPRNSPAGARVVASMEEVEMILDTEGATMVYMDGGKTVQEFLRRGWVDEMVLTIAPVLLGGGGKGPALFGDVGVDFPGDMHFTLRGVDVIEDGMVSCYYQVKA
ncbi:dihydrofolate reductase family protein [Aspergillus puulaauensis]|uniref:2,5-diamino-6-ribosylamino-4(3H)-pyrimidinone 5'-phosphate reductase n=1 Tax=Aspergillus puulaauensis TaxID=1220207 RepID=A0A7R7XW96_9EURO|nr:uncharacterized protein APUU_70316A [Aspergillus puulaauensis]BCS28746.1 hypothetical protein APUU_70316A [Aspergillus puulaauensis]